MKSDNIGLPNTSSFIPHLGSVSSYFPCTFFLDVLPSSQNQYIAKQTSFSLPHASLPVLISRSAAGCLVLSSDPSWQGSFHNVYFFFSYYWNFLFLLFSLMSSLTSWRPSSILTPSCHHTIPALNSFICLSFPLLTFSLLVSPPSFLLPWFFYFLSFWTRLD